MRIAHLSDVHVLAPLRRADLGTRFVSFGRSLDPKPRLRKLVAALRGAEEHGADVFVISGDLTEVGNDEQFEAFADALHESRISADRILLVPGNHDAYTRPDAWQRALAGPLAPFRALAADQPGKSVEVGSVTFLPLDVACHQKMTRSAGELGPEAADALEARVRDASGRGQAIAIVLHHHPFEHASRAWQWVDGLRGTERVMRLLAEHEDVHVLHGHLHKPIDRAAGAVARPRIFGATATVDDALGAPMPRLYDVVDGMILARARASARLRAA